MFIEGLLSLITCQDHDLRHRGLTALCLHLPLWKIGDLPHVTGLVRINWHSAYEVLRRSCVKKHKLLPAPRPPCTLLRAFLFLLMQPLSNQVRLSLRCPSFITDAMAWPFSALETFCKVRSQSSCSVPSPGLQLYPFPIFRLSRLTQRPKQLLEGWWLYIVIQPASPAPPLKRPGPGWGDEQVPDMGYLWGTEGLGPDFLTGPKHNRCYILKSMLYPQPHRFGLKSDR